MQHITGKPSFVLDAALLVFNIIIDISLLLSGAFLWFFILLIFTALPAARLIKTLRSGIVVNDRGVFGKIKKEQFRLEYHEISSVSMADEYNSKSLLIVSGYKSYIITIRNARAVRDAIAHNMAVLGTTPAPLPTPAPEAHARGRVTPTLSQKFNRTRKWILIIFLTSVVTFIPFGTDIPVPFSSLIAHFTSGLYGLFFGILVAVFYFVLWLLSKNRRFLIVVALIAVALETVFVIFAGILAGGLLIFLFVYVLPYSWVLFCLARGTSAWRKLRSAPQDETNMSRDILQNPGDVPASAPQSVSTPATPSLSQALYTNEYPSILMTDSLKQQIVEICRSGLIELDNKFRTFLIDKFYIFDGIPLQKLEKAVDSYASSLAHDEKAIFLYDNTLASSAKSGFILTSKCLHTKSDMEKATKSYIQNIDKVIDVDKNGITVEMDAGTYIIIRLSLDKQPKAAIIRILDETIRLLKSHL